MSRLLRCHAGWHEEVTRLVRHLTSALGMGNDVEYCEVGSPFSLGPDLLGCQATDTVGSFRFTSLQVLYLHDELDFLNLLPS